MYQCEFMKLPIERPRIPDMFVVDGLKRALFYRGGNSKVTVPTAYNGKEINALSGALFMGDKNIKELVILEGITTVE